MHNRKILILCKGGIQNAIITIKHNVNNKWPHKKDEKNIHQFLDYTSTYPNVVVRFYASGMTQMRHIWLIQKHKATLQGFLRDYTFKICAWAPELPNTCQLQHFKICCRFFCKSINQRMFCDRNRCHHSTKHIRRNGPLTAH